MNKKQKKKQAKKMQIENNEEVEVDTAIPNWEEPGEFAITPITKVTHLNIGSSEAAIQENTVRRYYKEKENTVEIIDATGKNKITIPNIKCNLPNMEILFKNEEMNVTLETTVEKIINLKEENKELNAEIRALSTKYDNLKYSLQSELEESKRQCEDVKCESKTKIESLNNILEVKESYIDKLEEKNKEQKYKFIGLFVVFLIIKIIISI